MLSKNLFRLHYSYVQSTINNNKKLLIKSTFNYSSSSRTHGDGGFSQTNNALKDVYSEFSLEHLNSLSKKLSKTLLKNYNCTDLNGEKIAVLCSNNYSYLVSLMAIWQANGVPLGLNKHYPTNLIEYFIKDSQCKLVINGIAPNEVRSEADSLDDLLSKNKVHNFKIIENEFYKLDENQLSSDESSLEFFKKLLNKPEDANKEALILYTRYTN